MTDQPTDTPAPVPPADRAGLGDRIADALAAADGWTWAPDFDRTLSPAWQGYRKRADAVLAMLPTTDQTAVLREADWIVEHCPDHGCVEPETTACHCEIADRLRRLAAEAQQSECTAARTGRCLREAESETACNTDAGECVHGGRPAFDDTDLTESDIDRLMAAGVPVQIVTAPPNTHGAEAQQPAADDTTKEPRP